LKASYSHTADFYVAMCGDKESTFFVVVFEAQEFLRVFAVYNCFHLHSTSLSLGRHTLDEVLLRLAL
jgi:hypothetical protein